MNYNRRKDPVINQDIKMNWFQRWRYNLQQVETNKKIVKCNHCKKLTHDADWHYLRCEHCGEYIYDSRELF